MLHEHVELVVMRPVAGVFDVGEACIIEVLDAPVGGSILARTGTNVASPRWYFQRWVAMAEFDSRGTVKALEALPTAERMMRYRELAADAFKSAQECEEQGFKTAYLNVASCWHSLADDLEREIAGGRPLP